MTEEEKKAIEDIKLLSIGDFITWFNTDGIIKMGISAKTVLNLVAKLQKEIKEKDRYIKNSEDITTEMNNDINKLILENKNKYKQIDLMAFSLADYVMYYEYDKCRNPEMIKQKAKELKQHFETKVKKEQ